MHQGITAALDHVNKPQPTNPRVLWADVIQSGLSLRREFTGVRLLFSVTVTRYSDFHSTAVRDVNPVWLNGLSGWKGISST